MREVVEVRLTDEYKKRAMELMDDTIDIVADKFNYNLSSKDKMTIKNFSLDQVNVNVTSRTRLKTMWVFDTEKNIPVTIEKGAGVGDLANLTEKKGYLMRPNLSWTFKDSNVKKDGLNRKQFEEKILRLLLEDFETAAFYGTLSFVTEGDTDVIKQ